MLGGPTKGRVQRLDASSARVVYHVVYHNYGSDSPVYGSLEGHPDSDDDERGSTDSQVAAFS